MCRRNGYLALLCFLFALVSLCLLFGDPGLRLEQRLAGVGTENGALLFVFIALIFVIFDHDDHRHSTAQHSRSQPAQAPDNWTCVNFRLIRSSFSSSALRLLMIWFFTNSCYIDICAQTYADTHGRKTKFPWLYYITCFDRSWAAPWPAGWCHFKCVEAQRSSSSSKRIVVFVCV